MGCFLISFCLGNTFSHPFTVAISAAHNATGINHSKPPNNKKNTKLKPEVANVGYSYNETTIEMVIAKKPKNVNFLQEFSFCFVA